MQLIKQTNMDGRQLGPMESLMLSTVFQQTFCACGEQAEIIELDNRAYCHACYLKQVVAASKTVTEFVEKAKETS